MPTATKSTKRKTVVNKASANKQAPRKNSAPRAKKHTPEVKSFRVSRPTQPFMTFGFTRESSYWLVLGIVVIAFGWWIMKLQSDIQSIYDSIDANSHTVITQPFQKTNKKD